MSSDKINDYIEEQMTPYLMGELMCVSCLHRWIDVHPESVWLKDLECPHCGKKGFLISTGQIIDDDTATANIPQRLQ